ncbi:MAG: hypothetical protein R3B48_18665 [Kofleriaceae bacterium]
MRFCPWYALDEAPAQTPAAPNLLQVRVARGLVAYPRGQSAMIHYEHAADARARAIELGRRWPERELWCRHLIEIDDAEPAHLAELYAKLSSEFVRRFGCLPAAPELRSPSTPSSS